MAGYSRYAFHKIKIISHTNIRVRLFGFYATEMPYKSNEEKMG